MASASSTGKQRNRNHGGQRTVESGQGTSSGSSSQHQQVVEEKSMSVPFVLDDMDDTYCQQSTSASVVAIQPLTDQERFLPISNVARIMKRMVPDPGKVAKETKECAQECLSEFIGFIASEAAERSQQEKRKTINGEDILNALQTLGFDNFIDPLKTYLVKYREAMRGDQSDLTRNKEVLVTDGDLDVNMFQVHGDGDATTITLQAADGKALASNNQNVIYMDPATNKNYIMLQGANGQVQLIEVQTVLQADET